MLYGNTDTSATGTPSSETIVRWESIGSITFTRYTMEQEGHEPVSIARVVLNLEGTGVTIIAGGSAAHELLSCQRETDVDLKRITYRLLAEYFINGPADLSTLLEYLSRWSYYHGKRYISEGIRNLLEG